MDNPLAVYRSTPASHAAPYGKRCRDRAVAAVRVHWGLYVLLICAEHANTLAHGTPDMRILPNGLPISEVAA